MEIKALIQKVIFSLENDTFLTDQVKWELLKCEIWKVSKKYESFQLTFLEN